MDHLLTSAEIAERLRVSRATIGQWTRENIIPALRIRSNLYRYDFDQVVQALTDRQPATLKPGSDEPRHSSFSNNTREGADS